MFGMCGLAMIAGRSASPIGVIDRCRSHGNGSSDLAEHPAVHQLSTRSVDTHRPVPVTVNVDDSQTAAQWHDRLAGTDSKETSTEIEWRTI